MKQLIKLKVNGVAHEVEAEPYKTLLAVLREDLKLTGSKVGCAAGECGACTVFIDGKSAVSCLVLAVEAQGKEITTIEGLAKGGKLTPVQAAFVENGVIECGFCTSGMVMSATALLAENPDPTDAEIVNGISGHICACSGYHHIIQAIKIAAKNQREGK